MLVAPRASARTSASSSPPGPSSTSPTTTPPSPNTSATTTIPFPAQLTTAATLIQQNRYGENPHQRGAFYRTDSVRTPAEGIGAFEQHHGKAMSYVNFLDADAAYNLVADFQAPTMAIIKHTNAACFATSPGAVSAIGNDDAPDADITALYERALTEGDFVSAYGGIVATNRTVDLAFATALRDLRSPESGVRMFYEIVIAPRLRRRRPRTPQEEVERPPHPHRTAR